MTRRVMKSKWLYIKVRWWMLLSRCYREAGYTIESATYLNRALKELNKMYDIYLEALG